MEIDKYLMDSEDEGEGLWRETTCTSARLVLSGDAGKDPTMVPQNGVSFRSGFLASCEILDLDIY